MGGLKNKNLIQDYLKNLMKKADQKNQSDKMLHNLITRLIKEKNKTQYENFINDTKNKWTF